MSKNYQGIRPEPIPDTAAELLILIGNTELTEADITLDDGRIVHVVFEPGRIAEKP